jgi:glycerol dehydrogenase
MLKVFGGPSRYIQGPGAIDRLGECAALFVGAPRSGTRGGFPAARATLVIDSYVNQVLGARLEAICAGHGVTLHTLIVEGDLTPRSIAQLRAQAATEPSTLVVAVGGGKSLDAGKAVAKALHCHMITVPTVASNDAPTSKNYVLYDDSHNLLAVEHMLFNPTMVIVDTALIATAPAHFFRAGLGDAVSKKFEAEQCGRNQGLNMYDGAPTLTAQLIADGCLRTLMADGEQALAAAGTGASTPAFERVVEAMILMSGLGFESGGLSIAHALTRGLPRIAGVGPALHGMQVALGLLVQLDLENRADGTLAALTQWYRRIGLPTTLGELGATRIDEQEVRQAAALTLKARHAAHFDYALTEDALTGALLRYV